MSEVTVEMRRHSAAHLMARAIMGLFKDVQVDIGPATDEGFYYDFDLPAFRPRISRKSSRRSRVSSRSTSRSSARR